MTIYNERIGLFMNENTRNFHAHGGHEWVIGGKLTILPGAVIEGAEKLGAAFGGAGARAVPYIPDSDATTVAQLRDSFNALVAAMRQGGAMAADP
jgi:hypothetical protein